MVIEHVGSKSFEIDDDDNNLFVVVFDAKYFCSSSVDSNVTMIFTAKPIENVGWAIEGAHV